MELVVGLGLSCLSHQSVLYAAEIRGKLAMVLIFLTHKCAPFYLQLHRLSAFLYLSSLRSLASDACA